MITACLTYAIVLVAYYFVQTGYSAGYINQLGKTVAVSLPRNRREISDSSTNVSGQRDDCNSPTFDVAWDLPEPETTSWITGIVITSETETGPNTQRRVIATDTTTYTLKPPSSSGDAWTRVSLYPSGCSFRPKNATYYFGCQAPDGGWELEDKLYGSSTFRSSMLMALLGSYVVWTYLAVWL